MLETYRLTQPPIRVLLADDNAVLRKALTALLSSRCEVEVVGECCDGAATIVAAEKVRPDVVLMDFDMPGVSGLDATRQICGRLLETQVVILSGFSDPELVEASIRAGASGYVVKRADVDELILAVQAVRAGEIYVSSHLAVG